MIICWLRCSFKDFRRSDGSEFVQAINTEFSFLFSVLNDYLSPTSFAHKFYDWISFYLNYLGREMRGSDSKGDQFSEGKSLWQSLTRRNQLI